MPARWWDLDWSAVPAVPDPEVQAWTQETLARIAQGGREEEVAAWRARMAERVTSKATGTDLFVGDRGVVTAGR